MNNELAPTHPALVNYNPGRASLLEMRAHPEMFPRLKTIPREQAVFEMSKIVSQAFLYRGQAADPTNIQFISTALVAEIMDDRQYGLASLSLAEIQVVVKRAVLGGSEMFGISVSSLYKTLIEFAKGEGHLNQKKVEERKGDTRHRQQESPVVTAFIKEYKRNHKI